MLQLDETIVKILLKEKSDGNQLLKHFKIGYPSKNVVQESVKSVHTDYFPLSLLLLCRGSSLHEVF